ncbi:hypothetical protein CMMCAS08_15625 [Clavibacter michiganensis subsp. michiganensis]|nr:hypothetical protein DOU02_01390 [Clavibacter michiganensis subsp. michiganensis]OUE00190.1 hypothetical protein CMMCAS06_00540 [Clavibacter michiganensis subsp. michiganensis]OUE01088.1 hypothetical protein CMMCAS08_15625 [Clavibacter michiganensis subsp. michiganensis]
MLARAVAFDLRNMGDVDTVSTLTLIGCGRCLLKSFAHPGKYPQCAAGTDRSPSRSRTLGASRVEGRLEGEVEMARKRYDVVYKLSVWTVTHAGSTVSTHSTKQYAIDAGVALARANQPSQLIIHQSDGTIEDERTYGNDPFPPRG